MPTYIIESTGPHTPDSHAMQAAAERLGQSPWVEVYRTRNGSDRVRMRVVTDAPTL